MYVRLCVCVCVCVLIIAQSSCVVEYTDCISVEGMHSPIHYPIN